MLVRFGHNQHLVPRRPLKIPGVMEVKTLADVLTLIGHLPKATRAKDTWQHDEAELKKAAAGADATQVSIALQMVPQRASNISEVPSRPTYGDLLALSKG